jgi:NADH dehydrogenase
VANRPRVVIVGAGFGGLSAAHELKGADVDVIIVDQHNFHTFQPLLYQVATAGLNAADVAYPVRAIFRRQANVQFRQGSVSGVDGEPLDFDYLIVAAGATTNTFGIEGVAEYGFPIYDLADSIRLRNHVLERFEAADADPSEIDRGALTFVVVGGGPTGVELAGALADLIHETMTDQYPDLPVTSARIHLVDLGHTLLGAFSDQAHDYVTKILSRKGVQIHLGVAVTEVGAGHVALADGTVIRTRCVVWGGGIMAPPLAAASGLPRGRGGRIDVLPELSVEGAPGVYAIGDVANIPAPDGGAHPQLGSVALQSGTWAADNIRAAAAGRPQRSFHYHDKGIMAMIGRGAAIAEVGKHRHELHGTIAFSAWLGVHATLMNGVRNRVDAFITWGSDYFTSRRGPQILDRTDVAQIDWDEDREPLTAP